jgi:hypothetical protein
MDMYLSFEGERQDAKKGWLALQDNLIAVEVPLQELIVVPPLSLSEGGEAGGGVAVCSVTMWYEVI